jgi:hypothetical protein
VLRWAFMLARGPLLVTAPIRLTTEVVYRVTAEVVYRVASAAPMLTAKLASCVDT